ncbi:MAG: penicillin-binding protein 2 [Sporichthyaceae bacterium]
MKTKSPRRVLVAQVGALSLMCVLGGRLWYLQTAATDEYTAAAHANTVREVVTPAPRGEILDRTGKPLVRNRDRTQVTIDRELLGNQPDNGAAVLKRLAAALGTTPKGLRTQLRLCGRGISRPCWNGSRYQPVPVAKDVDPSTALSISERRELFPSVNVEHVSERDYPAPFGANAAHLLGYLQAADANEAKAQRERGRLDPRMGAANVVGRAGLERQYDEMLRGTPGVSQLAVDHLGRVLEPVGQTPAVPGNNLVTTIDARMQAIAEKQLLAAIERARREPDFRGRTYPAESGAVVVLDVTTGAVVAMAAAPTFEPSSWVGGIDPESYAALTAEGAGTPLLSRAFGVGAPPGSTFKIVSTAAALVNGWNGEQRLACPGFYRAGNRVFRNFESKPWGYVTLARALEVSCDTVYYDIAYQMWLRDGGGRPVANPLDPMQAMARAFGFGRPTGIDLPGEAGGRIVDREYRKRTWEATRERTCARAKDGYPDVADAQRAEYLTRLAVENCADGWQFRAGDAINFSIGQGETLVTPLQLARAYAAIANGGTLWRPHLAKAEVRPDGTTVREFAPRADGEVGLPDSVMEYLRKGLAGVSERGTARGVYGNWPLQEVPVASKTGTAERYGEPPSAWMAGYLPANDKPRYAVVMTVSQGGTGAATTGESVRAIQAALVGVGRAPVMPADPIPPPESTPIVVGKPEETP